MRNESFTTEEIAQILKVSKLTVYDLIKKGELKSYRVGRQMRVDATDLENYKKRAKGISSQTEHHIVKAENPIQGTKQTNRSIIISGQDMSLDILCKYIEKNTKSFRPLRSYVGSLESLFAMYKKEADIVSTHLIDGDTFEYNIPYIRKLFVSERLIVVNLISRWAGFYVKKGNPKGIQTWNDIATNKGLLFVNREKGSGVRTFVDEMMRVNNISRSEINGYYNEETSHLGVAGKVANEDVDVGVGIEKAAQMVGIDFIPLTKERYDLVILKNDENKELISLLLKILQSSEFIRDLAAIGYDVSLTGKIIFEQ